MIRLTDVCKVYRSDGREVRAVDGVSLEVPDGETLCLIGTSGSGKTTTMKMINRLIEPTEGEIQVNGQDVRSMDLTRLRRSLGYVIQKGGLFPHRTVAENVGLLPRLEGWKPARVRARVEELLTLVNLPPQEFSHRYPMELSGGQQQRVGVARALALDPPHILMDEPFGALDPITRDSLHEEFLRLKREVRKTILMVTHDLPEAFKLGDRIALMHEGRLVQHGRSADFRLRPANQFVEDFMRSHLGKPSEVTVADLLDPAVGRVDESECRPPEPSRGYRLAVDDGGRLRGLVHPDGRVLENPPTLAPEAGLREAVALLLAGDTEVIPVCGGDGTVVGAVTRSTILDGLGP